MAWVVFTVLLGIAFWVGVAMFVTGKRDAELRHDQLGARTIGAIVAVGTLVVWAALSVGLSMHRLGTGEVALVYDFSGKLTGTRDQAGIVWTAPWQHLRRESVQIQREEFFLDEGNAAVSRDQQPIFARLVLNYQIDPRHVIDLYRQVGPNWKAKLVDSRVLQDFKEITATYPTTDMTAKREQLRSETRTRLRQELTPYSIEVTDFFIQNIGFSQGYTNAIEQKQVQVQAAARAQAKVAQVEAEARQKVAQAEGEAAAKLALARAEAKSNRLISASVTDRLIALKRAEALQHANTIYVPEGTSLFVQQGQSGK